MRKHMIYPSLYACEFMELTPYKTYVYAPQRDDEVYIVDTFCGSAFMGIMKANYPGKDFVMINTHYRFDHIWGNCSFSHHPIYAHQLCKTMVQRYGIRELQEQKRYPQGTQTLILPDHCLNGKQLRVTDDFQPLYTSGHTLDGISICDQTLNALFVGGTLEKSLIQIEGSSLSEYRQTLEYFLILSIAHFYAGHTLQLTKANVRDTLAYIHALSGNKAMRFDSEETQGIRSMNLNARKRQNQHPTHHSSLLNRKKQPFIRILYMLFSESLTFL